MFILQQSLITYNTSDKTSLKSPENNLNTFHFRRRQLRTKVRVWLTEEKSPSDCAKLNTTHTKFEKAHPTQPNPWMELAHGELWTASSVDSLKQQGRCIERTNSTYVDKHLQNVPNNYAPYFPVTVPNLPSSYTRLLISTNPYKMMEF